MVNDWLIFSFKTLDSVVLDGIRYSKI